MNRGLARRTVFETRADARLFLSLLARAVHSGAIEVYAFVVLSTHFHVLLRSVDGNLPETMRRLLNGYVRWFNRSRRRDGPLFRGRYTSRRVASDEYRRAVVRYIDLNPLDAGIAIRPEDHAFGSARAYARRCVCPWLERSWAEEEARRSSASEVFDFDSYRELFHRGGCGTAPGWVERRLHSGVSTEDDVDSLIGAAPERVLDWMRRKAALGDGTGVGQPVCDPARVARAVESIRNLRPDVSIDVSIDPIDLARQMEVVLLRLLCGCRFEEIAQRCGLAASSASKCVRRHPEWLAKHPLYGSELAELARRILADEYGVR